MGIPQIVLCPETFLLLMLDCLGQSLGQRERQRDSVLGYHRSMNIARIGHEDVAGAQLGRYKLMHRRGRGMDPAQLLCGFDLLSAQRPRDRDVCVGNCSITRS